MRLHILNEGQMPRNTTYDHAWYWSNWCARSHAARHHKAYEANQAVCTMYSDELDALIAGDSRRKQLRCHQATLHAAMSSMHIAMLYGNSNSDHLTVNIPCCMSVAPACQLIVRAKWADYLLNDVTLGCASHIYTYR